MKLSLLSLLLFLFVSCNKNTAKKEPIATQETTDFRVVDSKYIDNDVLWKPFVDDLKRFSKNRYNYIKPLILEKDIPSLQKSIENGDFTYEELVLFYLHRIQKYDRENPQSLNAVIAINPKIIKEAKAADVARLTTGKKHPVFGMPILLKDNINTAEMPTTAGAVALLENHTQDAFVVKQLKAQGALILGKVNLSEWAYFFCGDCPSGYSAVGGQTLNPYGRKQLDTGGSSSGSGVAVAANFAVAAVGTETSGSILSPASQNSVVGLKPTVGLLSRSGIVPISSTLDTPGPMTKSVIDNAILLSAMAGLDSEDSASIGIENPSEYYLGLVWTDLKGKRFGAIKTLLSDSLYKKATEVLAALGAEIIPVETEQLQLPNFIRLLNLDMKNDLPHYLATYGNQNLMFQNIEDIIAFNQKDSIARMPYGQMLFEGIVADTATPEEFQAIKDTLFATGKRFFDKPMQENQLDGILSINNFHAGYAAVAKYPALTLPMGYDENQAPKGLTFISGPLREMELLQWAYLFEKNTYLREHPASYKN
ncbi:MAG TPA: amidase family protein [Flavobacteriaceae bacterium]|nr:amidase family protein [Flavobacteriaceae bacterium]